MSMNHWESCGVCHQAMCSCEKYEPVPEFAKRVVAAAIRVGGGGDTATMWRECALKWGWKSPPANGCLLALVREAWGVDAWVKPSSFGTSTVNVGKVCVCGRDEAEALVAALEAAPGGER